MRRSGRVKGLRWLWVAIAIASLAPGSLRPATRLARLMQGRDVATTSVVALPSPSVGDDSPALEWVARTSTRVPHVAAKLGVDACSMRPTAMVAARCEPAIARHRKTPSHCDDGSEPHCTRSLS